MVCLELRGTKARSIFGGREVKSVGNSLIQLYCFSFSWIWVVKNIAECVRHILCVSHLNLVLGLNLSSYGKPGSN